MSHPYESLIGYEDGARKIHVHLTTIKTSDKAHKYIHAHEAEEAMYFLEGSVRYQRGDEVKTLGPGDIVFLPAGVEHGPLEFLADELKYLVIRNVQPGESCCCERDKPPNEDS